ncbi:uncharacterized protein LOC135849203 [Planococcus citri]|uniref:uncharacterized protein LOC135849203 n=1 Tax=Planococcus citri TaxID=170843 RepID=UPI0031F89F1B
MDIILPENVFDLRLESRSDSATNLFACLGPENMSDNGIQATLNDTDADTVDEHADQTELLSSTVETTAEDFNTRELFQSGTEDDNETQISSETRVNEFLPTIIDIRGACDDSSNPETSRTNAVDETIAANENDVACVIDDADGADTHTISDTEEPSNCDNTNNKSDTILNSNVVIKQEPRDEDVDNDCMLVDSNDIGTCFTSEIEIKEERINEDNDDEVYCVETTSKIPLPIPIKIEANLDNDNEVSPSKPVKAKKSGKKTDSSSSSSKNTSTKLYSSAYRCHLCNTTFQEHELLNEHMKLHRNNSLIERYNKVYGTKTTRKNSKYICRTCGKRLSTGQSLTQHMMIHNNEKPHVCPICKKDFRHLSNFKMHVQKHKEEDEQRRRQREKQKQMAKAPPLPLPAPADRSVARSADFGRLVGPLFVKESLLKGSSSSEISRPMITPKTEYRKPFELKYTTKPSRHENAKENLIYYKKITPSSTSSYDEKYSRARKFNDDIGDDVIPLKTFNNVENIVMNATKLIVKVDNLDPNLLKKKIKTPDISIDKSATSVHNVTADRKRKIQISPSSEGAKRLKIDQIENIIMDSGDATSASALDHADDNESNDNFDFPSYYDDDDDDDVGASSAGPAKQETLTTNELFELLNDDRDSRDASTDHQTTSPTKTSSLVADELAKIVSSPVKSTPPKSSNVIVLKSPSPRKPVACKPSPIPVVNPPVPGSSIRESAAKPQTLVETPARMLASPLRSVKSIDLTKDTPPKEAQNKAMNLIDDDDADEDDMLVDKCDMYDNAFRNVALRRLTLIRKKASQNGGKVENKYLLGPLFWRKALRKAQRNQLTREPAMTLHEAKLAYKRMNAMKFGKQDTRRTNDPAKLQQRAELKLQYILGRVKVMSDVNHLNLAGPLFWKRTLKLAGIHDPNDLKRLLVDDGLTINDVEFVTTKVTEPSSVESSTTSTTIIPTPTADMNGDVTIIDDDDSSNSNSIANAITSIAPSVAVINTNINSVASSVPRNTLVSLPSPLLSSSISDSEEKSPVALTGSDFLENIVVQRKPSQPITNGGHNSIVDGILNDDLLKPKVLEKPIITTTPVLTKSSPLSSVQVLKTIADSTKEPVQRTVTKAESILYDSLTKPRGTAPSIVSPTSTRSAETFDDISRTKPESCSLLNTSKLKPSMGPIIKRNTPIVSAATTASRSLLTSSTNWTTNTTKKTSSRASTSTTTRITRQLSPPPVQSRLAPALVTSAPEMDNRVVSLITSSTTTPSAPASAAVSVVADTAEHHQIEVPDSTTALEAGGNIILNVDSADFQLIADSKNENGQETNYVLVSDGNGGVQLIKENDFRLLEDAGATSNASHYIVNVPNEENFGNFDLMSNAAGGANGEQLAYIQLDNENFTTLQFIQDAADVALEDPLTDAAAAIADKQKMITGEKNVTIGGTNYVIAADPSADLNHIGKELSDFLHIDYGTLLKNDNQHQQT